MRRESLSTFSVRPLVSAMMMEKIMVVAPTTAVPISTGFAVALKVFPAPSFFFKQVLGAAEVGVEAEVFTLAECREPAR